MGLNLEQKQAVVAEVAKQVAGAQAIIMVENKGMAVADMTKLRAKARASGVYFRVVKNTLVRRAVENFPVTLYTSADCTSECKQARDFLNARGVPFTEKMLQKQEDVDELKKLVGDTFIPALKVGKQGFRGFEPAAYSNLLDLAGYPKSAAYGSRPSGGLAK